MKDAKMTVGDVLEYSGAAEQLGDAGGAQGLAIRGELQTVLLSASGELFLCGWIDDRSAPLRSVRIVAPGLSKTIGNEGIGRFQSANSGGREPLGVWATTPFDAAGLTVLSVEFILTDGQTRSHELPALRYEDDEFAAHLATFSTQLSATDRDDGQNAEPLERLRRRRASEPLRPFPKHNVEAILVAEDGGVFIAGWIDDALDPLREITLNGHGWRIVFEGDALARTSRDDVHTTLKAMRRQPFGYWGFASAQSLSRGMDRCLVELTTTAGARHASEVSFGVLDRVEMRNVILSFLASCSYLGNPQLESVISVSRSIGRHVVDLNQRITREIVANPYVERFGRQRTSPKGSIIVCLYGKPEYLFLQAALFSGGRGIEDYQFIFVSNSPELTERLLKEARICAMTFDIDITIVALPGNAGFGAANNAAAKLARSNRLLIVNPDVFPYDKDWAAKHSSLVETLPAEQTRLFGAPLFYDDGSLMHSGLYFDADVGVSLGASTFTQQTFIRVEHYGKGAPPDTAEFLRSRPVPAVTGAFISCARPWFEKLGGFCEDYVFGHYEDADLCLRSLEAGTAAWIHDLKLWHLEGKGSVRPPTLEGATTVNRWLFNSRWGAKIAPNLIGKSPRHPLLGDPSRAGAPDRVEITRREPAARAEPERKTFESARPPAQYREIIFTSTESR